MAPARRRSHPFDCSNANGNSNMALTRLSAARLFACACALGFAVAGADPARADGDIKAGRALTKKCEACHGADGISKIVEAPNIAGQNEAYIVKQLTAFKSGERKNDMMSIVAPTLSDEDVANLAAYYSAIPITIGKLPGE